MHELDDAIVRGHTDIESLKRYTGFGTGFCQGKSCVALCARRLVERGFPAALPFTPRPPFHPLPLAALAGLAEISERDARDEQPPPGLRSDAEDPPADRSEFGRG